MSFIDTFSWGRLAVATLSCLLTAYVVVYLVYIVTKPKIIGSNGSKGRLKEKLLRSCPILSERYWPTIWAFHCHLNTIFRAVLQKHPDIRYIRDILTLNDGGEVGLDWGKSPDPNDPNSFLPREGCEDTPVLLVIPGIIGCSWNNYIKHVVLDGLMVGYRPVVFNQRGIGGVKLKTIRTYCASDISDLFEVVQYIHLNYPRAAIVGVGISLGGMILTQYLHQLGKKCDLAAAITVSIVWDPFKTRVSLEHQLVNRLLYSRIMINGLKDIVESNTNHLTAEEQKMLPVNLDELMKVELVSDFDSLVTVPLFGFSCLDEYYRACCNSDKMHKIHTPFICITSADDPFVPKESLPFKEFEHNPHTIMVLTSYGGHFGFIEGFYPSNKTWMNRVIRQLLTAFKNN